MYPEQKFLSIQDFWAEREKLFDDAFDVPFDVLRQYDHIYFYYNPRRIHPFYQELVCEMRRKGRVIQEITHLHEISIR